MELEQPIPADALQLIHSFLDQVDTVLLGRQVPRDQRVSIVGELESQIMTLVERKAASGSPVNAELLRGIIEAMDPPESYVQVTTSIESQASTELPPQIEPAKASVPKFRFRKLWQSVAKRLEPQGKPSFDFVLIASVAAGVLCFLFFQVGMLGHSPGSILISLLLMLAHVGLGFYAWRRIKRSNGLLLGRRLAFACMLTVPLILINALSLSVLILTPLGLFLGAIALAAALVYANYRIVLAAWSYVDRIPSIGSANPAAVDSDVSSAMPQG